MFKTARTPSFNVIQLIILYPSVYQLRGLLIIHLITEPGRLHNALTPSSCCLPAIGIIYYRRRAQRDFSV
jgi:hypothetical protein